MPFSLFNLVYLIYTLGLLLSFGQGALFCLYPISFNIIHHYQYKKKNHDVFFEKNWFTVEMLISMFTQSLANTFVNQIWPTLDWKLIYIMEHISRINWLMMAVLRKRETVKFKGLLYWVLFQESSFSYETIKWKFLYNPSIIFFATLTSNLCKEKQPSPNPNTWTTLK